MVLGGELFFRKEGLCLTVTHRSEMSLHERAAGGIATAKFAVSRRRSTEEKGFFYSLLRSHCNNKVRLFEDRNCFSTDSEESDGMKNECLHLPIWKLSNPIQESCIKAFDDRRSIVMLFTGFSASGKSTLAQAVLHAMEVGGNRAVLLLDGDTFRQDYAADLGFSREDRAENLRRAGSVARAAADTGVIVLLSFIAPYAEDRARLRQQILPHYFIECWLSAPLGVCEERDVKGLYKRARSNDLKSFTGLTDTYEPPVKPDHVLPTHLWSVDQCCESLLNFLKDLRKTEISDMKGC